MKKNLYEPFPNFVLRTPLFPLVAMTRWNQEADPVFAEALFLASPEFAEDAFSGRKTDRHSISLTKYFFRASTRCTPFGLFAGCSIGTIGDKSEIELMPLPEYRRITRLDMQYICSLIQQLEKDLTIRKQLLFYPNDSLYYKGGKLRYIEYYYRKNRRVHLVSETDVSDYLTLLLDRAKEGAYPYQLADTITSEEITLDDALEFIDELIDSQLLKSELEPSVVGKDVLQTLIGKLEKLEKIAILPVLKRIQKNLNSIDNRPIGTTNTFYEGIIADIKTIGAPYEPKYLFQTDLFKPVRKATVSSAMIEDVQRLLFFLTALSQPRKHPNIEAFKEAFAKRYEERTIPLTDALDDELGLGYPYNASTNKDFNPLVDDLFLPGKTQVNSQINLLHTDISLLRKYVECLRNGERVISIENADFNFDPNRVDLPTEALSDTLSVMCSIISDSENKREILVKSINNVGGANLLGRFCHLDVAVEELIRSVAEKEKELNPDSIVAEISHLPESRIGNIASRPLFRDYVIHYLSNTEAEKERRMPVSDLQLSIKQGRLVLTSKKYGKEVIPKLTCAHNYSTSQIPIYRFLCDMQSQQALRQPHLSYGELFSHFDYLPRIQYGNMILAREKWIIKRDEIKESEKMPDDQLLSFFKNLQEKHKICQHVIVPDSDNEMYVDLQNAQSIRTMLALVKQRMSFTLEEFLFDLTNGVVQEAGENFTNEMIFIFHK